jgi:hypothetical protein
VLASLSVRALPLRWCTKGSVRRGATGRCLMVGERSGRCAGRCVAFGGNSGWGRRAGVVGVKDGPTEIRTRVSAVRGQRPWPLDDGASMSNGYRRSTIKPLSPNILLGDVLPLALCGAIPRRRDSGAGIRTPILRSRAACPACWTTPESSSLLDVFRIPSEMLLMTVL